MELPKVVVGDVIIWKKFCLVAPRNAVTEDGQLLLLKIFNLEDVNGAEGKDVLVEMGNQVAAALDSGGESSA